MATAAMPPAAGGSGARSLPARAETNRASPSARALAVRPAPQLMDTAERRVGQTLGTYRLKAILGRGGMGTVYKAEHVKLGREVALKVLLPEFAQRRDAVSRFFQEARTVNRIQHRNIVDVTDYVELDDGTTFIIMELLHGVGLNDWIEEHRHDTMRVLGIFIQICDALVAAHKVGVVHRDLKPDNVIIVQEDGEERVKLLDFGVAKLLIRDDKDYGLQTAEGAVMGTPAFMSPEQAGGFPVDARSDIYSLGAIMYELFTNTALFRGDSFSDYVRMHLNQPPVPPRKTDGGADMPRRLEAAILRCLIKEPERRYPEISELRTELAAVLEELARSSGRVTESRIPTEIVAKTAQAPAAGSGARNLAIVAVVVLLGGAAAFGLYIVTQDGGATARPAGEIRSIPPIDDAPHGGPLVRPLELDDTAAGREPVVVRFESKPASRVHEIGKPTASCTTPCDVSIPIAPGAPARRRYELRKKGYQPSLVVIDLTAPPAVVDRRLRKIRRRAPGSGPPGPGPAVTPDAAPSVAADAGPVEPEPVDAAPAVTPDAKPVVTPDAAPAITPDAKPAVTPDAGDVAPEDTLDPFKKQND